MSLTETTPLLEKQRQEEQEALAARHNGTVEEGPKSPWVIARLVKRLPPHHVGLAHRLCDLWAQSKGYATAASEFVDHGGNGREISASAQEDACRRIHGYEAAVRTAIPHRKAGLCFWSIVSGDRYEQTASVSGYKDGRGSYRAKFVELVQLVMIAAQEYDDEINTLPSPRD